MKKLFFIVLVVLFISNTATAQRQIFIHTFKNTYDTIMIDWIRSGYSVSGSWIRIRINGNNLFTRDRLSVQGFIEKNSINLRIDSRVINGSVRGKNISLSLENSNSTITDFIFTPSTLSVFNKLVSDYQKNAVKLQDQQLKIQQAAEKDQKRLDDLISDAGNLEIEIQSRLDSANSAFSEFEDYIRTVQDFTVFSKSDHDDFVKASDTIYSLDLVWTSINKSLKNENVDCESKEWNFSNAKAFRGIYEGLLDELAGAKKAFINHSNRFINLISQAYQDVVLASQDLDKFISKNPFILQRFKKKYKTIDYTNFKTNQITKLNLIMTKETDGFDKFITITQSRFELLVIDIDKWVQQYEKC
jgi:hypothetical protein